LCYIYNQVSCYCVTVLLCVTVCYRVCLCVFGVSVCVSLCVNGTGAVYLYGTPNSGGSWSQEQLLLASDGLAGDKFGYSTALYGTVLAVGAIGTDNKGIKSGGQRSLC
jgi:hypothetical protein